MNFNFCQLYFADGYSSSEAGMASCVASSGGNITWIWKHCKSGFRPVHWWQWARSCYARCCLKSVGYVAGGQSSSDWACGPWNS